MDEITQIAARGKGSTLRILAASALRAMLIECAKKFAEQSGCGFSLEWGTSGAINQRIRNGETFDLVASASDALKGLAADGLVAPDQLALGVSKLALGIRAGDTPPDISTLGKFRSVLMQAKSISRGDPAGGGTAGNHLVKVFAQMDVTEAVAAKSILRAGGFAVMKEVVEMRADFGLTQSTEIPAVDGVAIGAFLPDDVQLTTVYAIAAGREACEEANGFIRYLMRDDAKMTAASAGFAPV